MWIVNYSILVNVIFQSTFPLQGTTILHSYSTGSGAISIHVPIAGNDGERHRKRVERKISIHVPIAGNDLYSIVLTLFHFHFNPRSHCRERLMPKEEVYRNMNFNPRSHCRERLGEAILVLDWEGFQSTFPLQGTTMKTINWLARVKFQSTFPLQGTTANLSNF